MKKISIILACVIAALAMVLTPMMANGGNTVTAEATDSVVAVYAAKVTTEATTTEQESKTTKKSSNLRIKKVKPYTRYIKYHKVKVRQGPHKKTKVVKKHSKGTKVTVKAKCGDWRKIGKKKWVHKSRLQKYDPYNYYQGVRLEYSKPYNVTSHKLTRENGRISYGGHSETWYSIYEPGQTVTARHIPGKHIADDGTIRDKDGYVCVATSQSWLPYYSTLMTSRGPAKVYDCGVSGRLVDVYTAWR